MKRFKTTLLCTAVAAAAITQLGCGGQELDSAASTTTQRQEVHSTALPILNTFILQSLEIDQLGATPPADANLYVGADPADGSASAQKPTGGPATFIDWNDLGANVSRHRLQDLNNALTGQDDTSFPGSNECVGPSNVLSKMDLTYVAAANNNKWAYFAVQRSNNNGDAGYYWLFTKLPPKQLHQAPCAANHSRLLYDIRMGDVLIGGHFQPGKTALLAVYKAVQNADNVTAVDAINFLSALWQQDPNGVGAVAVNTTVTSPDSLGADGVIALTSGNLGPEIFAESAVPVSVFTGGNNCGAVFFGSVITRSSGSGGTSPDLKDLAGPAIFNFGETKAAAKITATCDLNIKYELTSAVGAFGIPITSPQCLWTFSDGSTASGCSDIKTGLPAGTHTATVKVTDPETTCSDTVTTAAIQTYAPLAVTADLTGGCTSSLTYSASPSGGSGNYSLQWTFGDGVTPSDPTAAGGTASVAHGALTQGGTVVVTDVGRADALVCTASAGDGAVVYKPTSATARMVPTCGFDVGFELTGTSGGAGGPIANPICLWSFDDGTTASGCSGSRPFTASQGGTTHTASVKVSDPAVVGFDPDAEGCSDVADAAVIVYPPLALTANLTGTCVSTFSFDSLASGGTGHFSYSWSFEGPGTLSTSSSSETSGVVTVSEGNTDYLGSLTITDTRPDGLSCPAVASDVARVFHPVKINLDRSADAPTCQAGMTSDEAHYAANPSGGSGNYAFTWIGAACAGGTCTINPPDDAFCYEQSFSVNVQDTDPVALAAGCLSPTSEVESYSKLTIVNASDN